MNLPGPWRPDDRKLRYWFRLPISRVTYYNFAGVWSEFYREHGEVKLFWSRNKAWKASRQLNVLQQFMNKTGGKRG